MDPFRRTRWNEWEHMRRRMLRETEVFLEEGLRHPEKHLRIPAIAVGEGEFLRGYADIFWSSVLGSS